MSVDIAKQSRRPLYRAGQTAVFIRAQSNTGLWYDKFCEIWEWDWTIKEGRKLDWIKSVTGQVGCIEQLQSYAARQSALASGLGGLALPFITATRFATGLGSEHPIEIGFAWHHTLGTPYLPGSGVKGLLRAWVRKSVDKELANDLFGPDGDDNHCVGKWICFDAIPTQPVQLEADVMTPHYGPYYQKGEPPGDWHDPKPIPFLAVARDQQFQFAFAPRNPSDTGKDENGNAVTNDTIAEWLTAALHWLGAGAKTNSGFGVFKPADQGLASKLTKSKPPGERRSFKATLELVTPAFLAGADQQDPTDCDLRPATLRGQLRYWWRTLHAGYLTVEELRTLEAALWGSTSGAGAIRVLVRRTKGEDHPERVPGKKTGRNRNDKEVRQTDTQFTTMHGLRSAPQKRAQGFLYLSYGMDEMPAGKPHDHKHRRCRLPGSEWEVVFVMRTGYYLRSNAVHHEKPQPIDVSLIETQAQAALSLLCQFGGVGSKSRNGYGSLQMRQLDSDTLEHKRELTPEEAELSASILRESEKVKLGNTSRGPSELSVFNERLMLSPIQTPWTNYWKVLDELGFAIQDFCQSDGQKRTWVKEALGLPRKIGPSENDGTTTKGFRTSEDRGPSVIWLGQKHPHLGKRKADDMRHASPIHFHISRSENGTLSIGAVAFPNRVLPDYQTSRDELQALINHLLNELPTRIKEAGPIKPAPGLPATTSSSAAKRPFGTPVRVRIKAERAKGGYDVEEEGRPQGILNLGPVPTPPPNVGDVVDAQIKEDAKLPQYQWPKPQPSVVPANKGKKI
jgi:CRISPR-associated protein Cmr6